MKLSTWCKLQGICYHTGFRWFHQGKIPNAIQMDNGTILINEPQQNFQDQNTYIYARVSNHDRKSQLETQIKRCEDFCIANGWAIQKTFKEIASGMNDSRPELLKLLRLKPKRIVIENKDRLTRFGFNYIKELMPNTEIIIINNCAEDKEDLMKDLISVITSFCGKLYSIRRKTNKLKQINQILHDNN